MKQIYIYLLPQPPLNPVQSQGHPLFSGTLSYPTFSGMGYFSQFLNIPYLSPVLSVDFCLHSLYNVFRSLSCPNKTLPFSLVHLYLPPSLSLYSFTNTSKRIHKTVQKPLPLPSVPGFPPPYLCSSYYPLAYHAFPRSLSY